MDTPKEEETANVLERHYQKVPTVVLRNGEYIEGYWAQTETQESPYSWPSPTPDYLNPEWFRHRHWILEKLERVEKTLVVFQESISDVMSDGTEDDGIRDCVISYRGLSTCRVCRRFVGNKEFVIRNFPWGTDLLTLRWPIGYSHYLRKHDIVPSSLFIIMIVNLELNISHVLPLSSSPPP